MYNDIFNRINKNKVDLLKFLPKNLPFLIHIAGTNGKGSTCSYLECVLMQKYKVGKFTSPHVLIPNERITINQEYISDNEMKYYYNKFKHLDIGFFEFFFLIAINYFVDKNVDICIIEAGIGGRLDTTNILKYDIALLTNASLDHLDILGNTIDKIAYEKSAIAKNNTKCFYSDKIFEKHLNKFTNDSKYVEPIRNFKLKLKGEFQEKNFALAYEVFKLFNLKDKEITKGLENFKIIGRQEYIKNNVLIDVSHNENSIKALIENLRGINNIHIFLSVLKDKDLKTIYNLLKEEKFSITLISMENVKRGRTKENIKEVIPDGIISDKIILYEDKLNVFCGSFYFISKVIKELEKI